MSSTSAEPRLRCGGRRAALAALLALAGCGPRVDAELPDVVVTRHEVEIPGWPSAASSTEPAVTVTYVQENADLGLPRRAYSEVWARELVIEAKSGITNLSFVRRLRVTVADANAPATEVEIARYEKGSGAVPGTLLSIPRDPPADVLAPFRAGAMLVTIEIAGALPVERWSVDVGVRASATLTY